MVSVAVGSAVGELGRGRSMVGEEGRLQQQEGDVFGVLKWI
jgi:hypothetical protein